MVAKAAGCWRLLPTCRHPSSVSARFRGKKPSQVAAATRNSPGIARELLLPKTNQVHREKGKIQREGSAAAGRRPSALWFPTLHRPCARPAPTRRLRGVGSDADATLDPSSAMPRGLPPAHRRDLTARRHPPRSGRRGRGGYRDCSALRHAPARERSLYSGKETPGGKGTRAGWISVAGVILRLGHSR